MRNVLFYTDSPNYGGAERQMEFLARHLPKFGYEASLACSKYSALAAKRDNLRSIYKEIYILPTFNKHDPWHFYSLRRLLRDKKFDLLHLHLWNPGACRYAFFAGRSTKTPIVTTEHDPFELRGIKQWIKKQCMARTDRFIAINSDNFRQLSENVQNPEGRIYRVHNGIELGQFLDNKDKASLGIKTGDLALTCIAELHPRKGHSYLFDAFFRLSKNYPMLHLFLVGRGPDETRVRASSARSPNIHLLGWRTDIPQILKATDIFVLPSLREAFGLSVLEAMASGVPVVASETSGTKDIIENGKSGLLVPPGDAQSLMEALQTLLNNPGQRADLAKAGQERAKLFSAERMAKETAEVYSDLLGTQLVTQ